MFQVLACGAAIVTLSMGIRHGFGLWLQPITQEMGWTRQSFALAIAIQNLSWGVIGIFVGMVADRFGAFRVLIGGAVLYGLGLAGMALSPTPTLFALTAGVLIGAAQAGTTYAVIYGVLGRQIAPERRSWAMGVAAAAGSFGQFLMVPVEGWLISSLGWQQALLALSLMVLLIVPLAFGLREPGFHASTPARRDQTIVQALGEAFRYPSFLLLTAGYFVCGFQVVFIGVHMPSYLRDHGLSPQVASYALALIGLFNVFGTYIAGTLGQRVPKRFILAFIYFARAIAIQNLSWGLIGIFVGMVADRFGAFRVLIGGAVLYGLGLVGMALSPTQLLFALTAGVLIGAAQAGTTYAVIYGVLGRQIAPEKRSWAMGVAAAAGSFGQFLMVPVEGFLIGRFGGRSRSEKAVTKKRLSADDDD